MTTLVSLATKDAIVMGSDSLGTTSRRLLDPWDLVAYFDPKTLKPRLDSNGDPVISLVDVLGVAEDVPYNHMPDITKILPLKPYCAGAMFAGIASIGRRSIKSLVLEFAENPVEKPTVYKIAQSLMQFINAFYSKELKNRPQKARPTLELIVAGYDPGRPDPKIYRIRYPEARVIKALVDFGVAFGGQTQEIQRLVFGTDYYNRARLEDRYEQLLKRYVDEASKLNAGATLPGVDSYTKDNHLFGKIDPANQFIWDLDGLDADWPNFSEQVAIDCVHFFIDVMIQAQRFNSRMPTVGGDIHIALITKTGGFRFISREDYKHGQHAVTREERSDKT